MDKVNFGQKAKILIILHVFLMVYSLSSVCSKMAANEPFLGIKFCLYYLAVIILLGVYAIGWQQIIKRMPLTVAFANKAVTVVWGIIWGLLFFQESISLKKLVGAALIILGIILYSRANIEETGQDER